MSAYRLIVVRCDGVSHSSDFTGWHGETAAFRYFNEAKQDRRTNFAIVFESKQPEDERPAWYARAEYHAVETGPNKPG